MLPDDTALLMPMFFVQLSTNSVVHEWPHEIKNGFENDKNFEQSAVYVVWAMLGSLLPTFYPLEAENRGKDNGTTQ